MEESKNGSAGKVKGGAAASVMTADMLVSCQIGFYIEIRDHLAGRGLWHELMIHPAAMYASGWVNYRLSGRLSAEDFCRAMRDYAWNLLPMFGEAPVDICPENPGPPVWWRCTGGGDGTDAVGRAVSKLRIRGREGEVREMLDETMRLVPGIVRVSELICRSGVLALPGVNPRLPDAVCPQGEPSPALLLSEILDQDRFWPKPGTPEAAAPGRAAVWTASGQCGRA